MEKVMIFDDGVDEEIHYIDCSFISADKTLCGERLHPINTIHIRKLGVTCQKCIEINQGGMI